MSNEMFSRTIQLFGEENIEKLKDKKLIIFGVGGVGGQTFESLVRAGFINVTIVDRDVVEISNLNRQIISNRDSIGEPKVVVAKKRMLLINPDCQIKALNKSITPENIETFNLETYDYIIDAIDSYDDKLALIVYALRNHLKIISSMGAGNRVDPSKVYLTTIEKTAGCPLAKKIRCALRKENLKGLTVVTSQELPLPNSGRKPGSTPFVPAAAGLLIASYIFTNVIGK